jgi:hypothetical protein
MKEPGNQPSSYREAARSNDMTLLIPEDVPSTSDHWNLMVVMTNTMPPRDPDDDDDDDDLEDNDLEDEENEDLPDEPPIVREPDEDEP